MNRLEHVLTIISEECNEVSQRVSKSLRFGLLNVEEGQTSTNMTRILDEYIDLVAMMEMLEQEIRNSNDERFKHKSLKLDKIHNGYKKRKERKRQRVEKYFKISKKEGVLK